MSREIKLNAKQRLFVSEYLTDLNAMQAAIRAGYSKNGAEVQGHRLLRNAKVAAAIEKAQNERESRTGITADAVLQELGRLGFSDLRSAFTDTGRLRRPEDWPDSLAAAVSSVEVVTRDIGEGEVEYVHKLRLWDKNAALDKIAKHLGMFVERRQHQLAGPNGEPIKGMKVEFV